ncbi:AMP-binding protein [Amycolatopsis sp. FBCC-B4732]|uniref:AMP-binding protein n=1 Tax=Amycolatopsis sp. FBCC-B4732 TaxID=3079339 RepID=UPI001FF39A1F|nr:AMP-binding protein [Amycolatopsis sp. FBCC-B4732]UOX91755.1 AMP-binding protein [Amycolatopsis sp. FBCC-B4732]
MDLLAAPGNFDRTDLSSLRKGYYGASAMPVEVLRELRRRLPDVDLWNFYGQTEMAPLATILRPHEQLERAGSAGRPSLDVETRIVDDEDEPVASGVVGEIVHRSPHATLGYYRDEDKTAETFRGGWFHSGDLGVVGEDGYLSAVDRKKDMIKTGGENVASREVEEALHLLDGVAEAAVFGIAHPHWIEAVTAVVVPREGVTLTAAQVLDHAKSHLAGYKCPKYVVFTERLPKNPSGKIVKRELQERHKGLATSDWPPICPCPARKTTDTADRGPAFSGERGTPVPPGPTGPRRIRGKPWRALSVGSRNKAVRRSPFRRDSLVSVFIAVLLALAAGLLVGSRVHSAREARANYSAYRARTAKGFGEMIRSAVSAVVAVAGALVLLFILLNVLQQA